VAAGRHREAWEIERRLAGDPTVSADHLVQSRVGLGEIDRALSLLIQAASDPDEYQDAVIPADPVGDRRGLTPATVNCSGQGPASRSRCGAASHDAGAANVALSTAKGIELTVDLRERDSVSDSPAAADDRLADILHEALHHFHYLAVRVVPHPRLRRQARRQSEGPFNAAHAYRVGRLARIVAPE
jgi:hypothetical protein